MNTRHNRLDDLLRRFRDWMHEVVFGAPEPAPVPVPVRVRR
jgi:hypothetical protein